MVDETAAQLFAEAAAKQGLPAQLEDPSAADRIAALIQRGEGE